MCLFRYDDDPEPEERDPAVRLIRPRAAARRRTGTPGSGISVVAHGGRWRPPQPGKAEDR